MYNNLQPLPGNALLQQQAMLSQQQLSPTQLNNNNNTNGGQNPMDMVPRWFEMLKELRNGTISYIQLIKREQVRPPVRPVCRRLGVAKLSDIVSEEILYRAIVQVADAQCRTPRREDNMGGGGGMGSNDYGGGDYGGGMMRGHHQRGIEMDDISSHSRNSAGGSSSMGGMYMGGGGGDRRGMSMSLDGLPPYRHHHGGGRGQHQQHQHHHDSYGGGGMGMSQVNHPYNTPYTIFPTFPSCTSYSTL